MSPLLVTSAVWIYKEYLMVLAEYEKFRPAGCASAQARSARAEANPKGRNFSFSQNHQIFRLLYV